MAPGSDGSLDARCRREFDRVESEAREGIERLDGLQERLFEAGDDRVTMARGLQALLAAVVTCRLQWGRMHEDRGKRNPTDETVARWGREMG